LDELSVCGHILHSETNNSSSVRDTELLDAFASLHEAPVGLFLLREHIGGALLVTHELSDENMHLPLVHLIVIAEMKEQCLCLLEGHVEVAEVLDVATEFVEDQVHVLDYLFIKLSFLGLHQVLYLPEANPKESTLAFLVGGLLLLLLLTLLEPLRALLHLDLEAEEDALLPRDGIAPYAMVLEVDGQESLPVVQ